MLRGDYATRAQVGISSVRASVITPNELRQEMGYDTHPNGNKLMLQAIGGRPEAAGDGEGDTFPSQGPKLNGSGKPNEAWTNEPRACLPAPRSAARSR
jgi:hypothetical protein